MNKRQREAAERNMLKYILDSKPEYKKIMDGLIDNPDKKLQDAIQPVIEEELKKARMIGVNIGFQGAMLQAYERIKDMNNVDEIKACLKDEANKIREKMGLKSLDEVANQEENQGKD